MSHPVTESKEIQDFLDQVAGLDQDGGDPRMKTIVRRLVGDFYAAIEDLGITQSEFWKALHFMQEGAPEFVLIGPGLGFDRFFDELLDAVDKKAGQDGGTKRAIEGPLYVEGAPLSDGFAEMCTDEDGTPMELSGVVKDENGKPIAGAIVDLWHAGDTGGYSHFDPSLGEYVFRRRIRTGSDGAYKVKSIVPSSYGAPPDGSTTRLCSALGRVAHRPAHVHYFISAPGYKHLTTQFNLSDDPWLYKDFAWATRDELIVEPKEIDGVQHLNFDITLVKGKDKDDEESIDRPRMSLEGYGVKKEDATIKIYD